VIYDFAAIQTGAPSYVKIMHNGAIIMFRMIVDDLSLRFETQTAEVCGTFGLPLATYTVGHTLDVSLNAHCVPMDTGGCLMTVIKKEKYDV
jgi:hypothetical protein